MDFDMGMCEDCGMKPANVQLTQIVGEEVTNLNICEDCASERGISISFNMKGSDNEDAMDVENLPFEYESEEETSEFELYNEDFQNEEEEEKIIGKAPIKLPPPVKKEDPQCKECGMKFSKFQESGALGCTNCYKSFEKEIENILNQVHAATVHKGKNYKDKALKEEDIKTLKSELSSAIENEEFELAAMIRDKIHKREDIN